MLTPPTPPPPSQEYTPFEARKTEARVDSFLIGMMGMKGKIRGISEKRDKNPDWGQESCSLPPRKMVPFQQEGLKLDLQKDFLTEIKGIGHRLGACEWGQPRSGKVWAKGSPGVRTTFVLNLPELESLRPTC